MGDSGSASQRLKLARFFVNRGDLGPERIVFSPAQQGQMRKVLRLRDGDNVVACDGTGTAVLAALRHAGPVIWGEPLAVLPEAAPPRRAVWLYASALRGDRMAWLLQKGTEIGVRGFVLVRFAHTQPAEYAARHDRYAAIVREAAEQCERALLPAVEGPMPFTEALAHSATQDGAARFLLDEAERDVSLRVSLAALPQPGTAGDAVYLFAGPEGGLTGNERESAARAGLRAVSLGSAILRSETAALTGALLALAASGDIG